MQNAAASSVRLPAASAQSSWRTQGFAVLGASVAVGLAAHVAFPLPFTPVPLTLQTLAVLGAGLALGPVAGFVAMICYLLEGAAGLPVFSPTGPGGLAQLIGPTGGFLFTYPLLAAVTGGLTRTLRPWSGPFLAACIACTIASVLLFAAGAGWLMHFAHLSVQATWMAGVAPFLPGEAIKVAAAAGVYRTFVIARSR